MKVHPALIAAGSETYLRDREVRRYANAAAQAGYRIAAVYDRSSLEEEENSARTFGERVLIVAYPDVDLKLDDVTPFVSGAPGDIGLLGILDGDEGHPEFPKPIRVSTFKRAKTRKDRRGAATRFAAVEAKRLGFPFGADGLADNLVGVIGDDLGIVAFEVMKAATLAKALGLVTISKEILQATIRVSAEVDLSPTIDALALRDVAGVLRGLARMDAATVGDAGMLVLRAKGGATEAALTWLRIASLPPGLSDADVAESVGTPLWAVQKRDLPAARRWGVAGLRRLVRALAEVERGIVEGRIPSTWKAIEAALVWAVVTK